MQGGHGSYDEVDKFRPTLRFDHLIEIDRNRNIVYDFAWTSLLIFNFHRTLLATQYLKSKDVC